MAIEDGEKEEPRLFVWGNFRGLKAEDDESMPCDV